MGIKIDPIQRMCMLYNNLMKKDNSERVLLKELSKNNITNDSEFKEILNKELNK